MQCSDLERYLEAYLDLRLGRSRGAILRRHLAGCPACRGRVQRLRQFEHDLQRRFRSLEPIESVWSGLEPDLVRSAPADGPTLPFFTAVEQLRALPAPSRVPSTRPRSGPRETRPVARPRSRTAMVWSRWSRRLMGAVLISAAVGTTISISRYWLGGGWVASTVQAYLAFREGDNQLDISSGDIREIENYLATRMGVAVSLPPTPAGFELLGARFDQVSDMRTASIVYEHGGLPALLYITPRSLADFTGPSGPEASAIDGISHLQWEAADLDYSVVSALPARDLLPFAEAI
jgi:anti-sigma factor RsiW